MPEFDDSASLASRNGGAFAQEQLSCNLHKCCSVADWYPAKTCATPEDLLKCCSVAVLPSVFTHGETKWAAKYLPLFLSSDATLHNDFNGRLAAGRLTKIRALTATAFMSIFSPLPLCLKNSVSIKCAQQLWARCFRKHSPWRGFAQVLLGSSPSFWVHSWWVSLQISPRSF